MRIHELQRELWLPLPVEEIFPFFANAENLQRITPPWMHFHILTPCPVEMRVGTLIDYRLRVRGFPLRWQSEITEWEPLHRFVDVQRRGPYRLWHHEHTFEESRGGTLCKDTVQYAVPFDFLTASLSGLTSKRSSPFASGKCASCSVILPISFRSRRR